MTVAMNNIEIKTETMTVNAIEKGIENAAVAVSTLETWAESVTVTITEISE